MCVDEWVNECVWVDLVEEQDSAGDFCSYVTRMYVLDMDG